MDRSEKPHLPNPRKGANFLSHLLLLWVFPLWYKGTRNGLNTEDRTKCLKEDKADQLGDTLEAAWQNEIEKASKQNRDPMFRKAMFNTFFPSIIFDGFLCFFYCFTKAIVPVILAQLLIQFQQNAPIARSNTNQTISINETNQFIVNALNRSTRSISSLDIHNNFEEQKFLPSEIEKKFGFHNLVPDFSNDLHGSLQNSALSTDQKSDHDSDVKKIIAPKTAYPKSDKRDEFMLNISRESFREFFYNMWTDVYWLAAGVAIVTMIGCLASHHSDLHQRLIGARMRVACCSLIYRKTLRLSKKSSGQISVGYLVNLLSNDVVRLDYGFIYAHYIWCLPFQAAFICYLIWQQIGIASVVGIVGLLIQTIPVQTKLSHLSSILRVKVAERTDKRVGIMNEIIQGIQVIKMYAWEKPFESVVAMTRQREIKQIRYASYIFGVYQCTMIFTERSTLFLTIAAVVFLGQHSISADVVFSLAQFYNSLQITAAIFYPLALSLGAEALVSLKRIEEYLLMEEKQETLYGITTLAVDKPLRNDNAIEMNKVSASWDADQKIPTLDDILLHVKAGQLCAIIGPVGAGKSSILSMLLGELPITSGKVTIKGDLSYASQEPWLFLGTVRDNILFGQEYNKQRYRDVIKCCALTTDLEQLPNGDRSIVGERGASLSGGQRARVSLARAVYKQATIYLLDDPLSAVDAHVGKHLYDEVIGPNGRLALDGATRLLVTHQVHLLKTADVIVIIENGQITRQGTYKELAKSNLDFAKLLEQSTVLDESTQSINDQSANDDHCQTYIIDTNDIPYIDGALPVGVTTVGSGGYQQLMQVQRRSSSNLSSMTKSMSLDDINGRYAEQHAEEQADGIISFKIWKRYFLAGGNWFRIFWLLFIMLFGQLIIVFCDYFVNFWAQQEYKRSIDEPTVISTYDCLYIYGIIIIAVGIFSMWRCSVFFNTCMTASKVLHNKMFSCLLAAPMRFFDLNPSGRILNRFSKDMGTIDELLPRTLVEAIQIILFMAGILIIVAVVNPLMIAALIIALALYGICFKGYLRPSQDLKRLEGISRSPIYSYLTATLSGVSTIRSRNLQDKLSDEFDGLQNVHSAIFQIAISANTSLGLWLDVISTVFVTFVTYSFIVYIDDTFSGNVGLAISQALVLTGMVQYGVRQIADSMQQMISCERILQYTDIESENVTDKQPPSNWPQKGLVEFKNMSLYYDRNDPAILKNLTLKFEPGWKIGIVGRTGAGKSSLISALFRLTTIDGQILIDDLETGLISLNSLRSNISIIPQDPVLFSATIRYNLDPFDLYSDDLLWRCLEDVELKKVIPSLEFMVTESGSNFSVGQRQLICLARAILRNNKVLVLDEATANVDPKTDILIQQTIRIKFKTCTVLTVAHRLHTVLDSDRILVLDDGYVKEFDIPHILLEQENSYLLNMVNATGPHESESLKRLAHETYLKLIENS